MQTPRLTTPHAGKFLGGACTLCGLPPESALHTYTLPGFESVTELRAEAVAIQQGEDLTAKMREPLKDVSRMAGKIEWDSPLFFGLGDNPSLF